MAVEQKVACVLVYGAKGNCGDTLWLEIIISKARYDFLCFLSTAVLLQSKACSVRHSGFKSQAGIATFALVTETVIKLNSVTMEESSEH